MKLKFVTCAILVSAVNASEDSGDTHQLPYIQQSYPSRVYYDLELEERLKIHALNHKNIKEDAFSHLLTIKECNLRQKLNNELKAEQKPIFFEKEVQSFEKILRHVDKTRAAEPILSHWSEEEKNNKKMLKRIFNFFTFESSVFPKKQKDNTGAQ